jgi:hypothetical protein
MFGQKGMIGKVFGKPGFFPQSPHEPPDFIGNCSKHFGIIDKSFQERKPESSDKRKKDT